MLNYILWIVSHLKMAWNLLLNYSFFPTYMQEQHLPGFAEKLGVVRYKCMLQQGCSDDDGEEEEEVAACAVCLCKIEEGDEMRELRCNHHFHKVCLDRWLGYSHSTTCPLCRTFLTPAKVIAGVEVITFNYSTFGRNRCDDWWLR